MFLKAVSSHFSLATIFLRIAFAATFLSAVSSRLSLWGTASSGWSGFLEYTVAVNSFAPPGLIPYLAVSATILEVSLAIFLLIGYKTRWAAFGASALTFTFAMAMTCSLGIKEPLDYSVFVDSAAALLLAAAAPGGWSVDAYLAKKDRNKQINTHDPIKNKA
jgi:putative oxidoreductase